MAYFNKEEFEEELKRSRNAGYDPFGYSEDAQLSEEKEPPIVLDNNMMTEKNKKFFSDLSNNDIIDLTSNAKSSREMLIPGESTPVSGIDLAKVAVHAIAKPASIILNELKNTLYIKEGEDIDTINPSDYGMAGEFLLGDKPFSKFTESHQTQRFGASLVPQNWSKTGEEIDADVTKSEKELGHTTLGVLALGSSIFDLFGGEAIKESKAIFKAIRGTTYSEKAFMSFKMAYETKDIAEKSKYATDFFKYAGASIKTEEDAIKLGKMFGMSDDIAKKYAPSIVGAKKPNEASSIFNDMLGEHFADVTTKKGPSGFGDDIIDLTEEIPNATKQLTPVSTSKIAPTKTAAIDVSGVITKGGNGSLLPTGVSSIRTTPTMIDSIETEAGLTRTEARTLVQNLPSESKNALREAIREQVQGIEPSARSAIIQNIIRDSQVLPETTEMSIKQYYRDLELAQKVASEAQKAHITRQMMALRDIVRTEIPKGFREEFFARGITGLARGKTKEALKFIASKGATLRDLEKLKVVSLVKAKEIPDKDLRVALKNEIRLAKTTEQVVAIAKKYEQKSTDLIERQLTGQKLKDYRNTMLALISKTAPSDTRNKLSQLVAKADSVEKMSAVYKSLRNINRNRKAIEDELVASVKELDLAIDESVIPKDTAKLLKQEIREAKTFADVKRIQDKHARILEKERQGIERKSARDLVSDMRKNQYIDAPTKTLYDALDNTPIKYSSRKMQDAVIDKIIRRGTQLVEKGVITHEKLTAVIAKKYKALNENRVRMIESRKAEVDRYIKAQEAKGSFVQPEIRSVLNLLASTHPSDIASDDWKIIGKYLSNAQEAIKKGISDIYTAKINRLTEDVTKIEEKFKSGDLTGINSFGNDSLGRYDNNTVQEIRAKMYKALNSARRNGLMTNPMYVIFDILGGSTGLYDNAFIDAILNPLRMGYGEFINKEAGLTSLVNNINELLMPKGKFSAINPIVYEAYRKSNVRVAKVALIEQGEYGIRKLKDTLTPAEFDEALKIVLSDNERKALNLAVDFFKNNYPEIVKVMWNKYQIRLPDAVDRYFPFVTKDAGAYETMTVKERLVYGATGDLPPAEKGTKHTIERTGAGGAVNLNFVEVLEMVGADINYLVSMADPMEHVDTLLKSTVKDGKLNPEEGGMRIASDPNLPNEPSMLGDVGSDLIKDWFDIVLRRGASSKNPIGWLRTLTKNVVASILAYRPLTVAKQMTAIFQAMPYVSTGSLMHGIIDIFTSKEARKFVTSAPEIADRMGGDQSIKEFIARGFVGKMQSQGMNPTRFTDYNTASIAYLGAYRDYMISHGKKVIHNAESLDNDAMMYAQRIVTISQGSGSYMYTSLMNTSNKSMFRNRDIFRAIAPMSTFSMNTFGVAFHNMFGVPLRSTAKGEGEALRKAKLSFSTFNAMVLMILAGSGMSYGYSKAKQKVFGYNRSRDKDNNDDFVSHIEQNAWGTIPFVGNLTNAFLYGPDAISPIGTNLADTVEGLRAVSTGEDKYGNKLTDKKKAQIAEVMALSAGTLAGIPILPEIKQIRKAQFKNNRGSSNLFGKGGGSKGGGAKGGGPK